MSDGLVRVSKSVVASSNTEKALVACITHECIMHFMSEISEKRTQ